MATFLEHFFVRDFRDVLIVKKVINPFPPVISLEEILIIERVISLKRIYTYLPPKAYLALHVLQMTQAPALSYRKMTRTGFRVAWAC